MRVQSVYDVKTPASRCVLHSWVSFDYRVFRTEDSMNEKRSSFLLSTTFSSETDSTNL